jgi:hypothetical protein
VIAAARTGGRSTPGRRQVFERADAACVASEFLDRLDIPEGHKRSSARLLPRHALADTFLDLSLQVVPQLLCHRSFRRRSAEHQPHAPPETLQILEHGYPYPETMT